MRAMHQVVASQHPSQQLLGWIVPVFGAAIADETEGNDPHGQARVSVGISDEPC